MRFALIGLGGIGSVRKAAIEAATNCELSAAFDVDQSAFQTLPNNIATFNSAEELLQSDSCDAVIISTPTQFHQSLAIKALENGKHVIVEKPMASTLDGAKAMQAAAAKYNKVLTLGFNHRYFQAIKDIHQAIQNGEIGELKYVKGFAGHTGLSEFKAKWMYDKDIMGGGTLMDNGIHTLDLICYLMNDDVQYVSGMIRMDTWQLDRSEDNAFVHLKTKKGIMGSLHSSWTEWKGYHFYVEAYGDKGMARAYYAPMMSTIIKLDKPGGTPQKRRNYYISSIFREKFKGWQSTVIQTFVEEMQDFICLCEGKQASTIATAADGVRSIAIPNAVYESSAGAGIVQLK